MKSALISLLFLTSRFASGNVVPLIRGGRGDSDNAWDPPSDAGRRLDSSSIPSDFPSLAPTSAPSVSAAPTTSAPTSAPSSAPTEFCASAPECGMNSNGDTMRVVCTKKTFKNKNKPKRKRIKWFSRCYDPAEGLSLTGTEKVENCGCCEKIKPKRQLDVCL